MGHYFATEPESVSKRVLHEIEFANKSWQVETDNEVFAKHGLDRGSAVLVKAILADLTENNANSSVSTNKQLNFYDLACGWGAVSLLVANFYPNWRYYLSDVNSRAYELAIANLTRSKVKEFQVKQASDWTAWPQTKFDIIALNPPIRTGKAHVKALLEQAPAFLAKKANFYCVIGKKQGAESYATYLSQLAELTNCTYALLSKENGFYVFKLSHR